MIRALTCLYTKNSSRASLDDEWDAFPICTLNNSFLSSSSFPLSAELVDQERRHVTSNTFVINDSIEYAPPPVKQTGFDLVCVRCKLFCFCLQWERLVECRASNDNLVARRVLTSAYRRHFLQRKRKRQRNDFSKHHWLRIILSIKAAICLCLLTSPPPYSSSLLLLLLLLPLHHPSFLLDRQLTHTQHQIFFPSFFENYFDASYDGNYHYIHLHLPCMVASLSRHIAEEGEEKALLICCSASFIFRSRHYSSTNTIAVIIWVIVSLQSTRDADVQQVDDEAEGQRRRRGKQQ